MPDPKDDAGNEQSIPYQNFVVVFGNTDNKLTQKRWSQFVATMRTYLYHVSENHIYFSGGANADSEFQNYCVVASADERTFGMIRNQISRIGEAFDQDSIAFIPGFVEFVRC